MHELGSIYSLTKAQNYEKNWNVFQLPSGMSDSENAKLAVLFSTYTLETIALQHFGVSEATTNNLKAAHRENIDGFNRDLLRIFRNKGRSRKVTLREMHRKFFFPTFLGFQ